MVKLVSAAEKPRRRTAATPPKVAGAAGASSLDVRATIYGSALQSLVEDARRRGLLDGEKTEHVSFRAPPGLLEAAKRETGITSTSKLGMLALSMLAQPDPVAALMKKNRGRLGKDHKLEY